MGMVFPCSQFTGKGRVLNYHTRVRHKLLDGSSAQVETQQRSWRTESVRDHAGLARDRQGPRRNTGGTGVAT